MKVIPPTTAPPPILNITYCPKCRAPRRHSGPAVGMPSHTHVSKALCETCQWQRLNLLFGMQQFVRSLRPRKPRVPKPSTPVVVVPEPERVEPPVDRSTCWSHKAYFSTEKEAAQYRTRHPGAKGTRRIYQCPWCSGFHFTHVKKKKTKIVGSWK